MHKKLLFLLIFFLPWHHSLAKVDPSIHWKRIQTDHFEIIFSEENTKIGKRYAEYAEIAYDFLIPLFKEAPTKTAVIVNDGTDIANGFATYLPYPHIVVYPTLPLPGATVSTYDRWGLGLMIHEYTHILSFYPAHGIYTPFKYIFGTVVRPLAITPRWYLEGLAVAMETRFTSQGRLRSPDTQAAIKAYIQDKKLYDMTVDKINEGANEWPYGGAPYLFGSIFWQKAIDEKGEGAIYSLLQDGSRRLPFSLNSSFKKLYDSSVEDFLTELYVESEENFRPIKTNETRLELKEKHRVQDFILSPNKKYLLTLQSNPEKGSQIILHERSQDNGFNLNKGKVITGTRSTERIGWMNDSNTIYYDKIKNGQDRYHTYFNLHTYDIKEKKETLIAGTTRAFHPHLSPNHRQIVFIKNGGGQNKLVVSDRDGNNQNVILSPKLEVRLSFPTYIDDENILFTMRDYSGKQKLFTIHVPTKKIKRIEIDDTSIFKIKKTGNNFLFTSYKNGAKNIYAGKPPFSQLKALTNTNTAISSGEWDSIGKKLYFAQLTSQGNKAFVLNKTDLDEINIQTSNKVVRYPWPTKSVTKPDIKISEKIEDYSPLKYMWPRYWIPYAYNVNDGFVFQGTTFVKDPLDKHAYGLGVSYDTVTEKPSYNFSYQNATTPLDLIAAYTLFNEPISGTEDSFARTSGLLGAGFYLPGMSNSWRGSLSWSYRETALNSTNEKLSKVTGPTASISYGDSRGNGQSLKSGFIGFSVSHNHNIEQDEFLKYDMTRMNVLYNFNHFLPEKHYLLFRLNGAYSENLPTDNTLISFGAKTIGGNFIANLINSSVLMRGYTSGAFAAQQMAVGSIGYDFPLGSVYRGPGLTPVFFKRIRGHIFTDAIGLKGKYLFTPQDSRPSEYLDTNFDETFIGSGAEIKMATTIGYHLPVEFILGLYYGYNEEASGGFIPFISFSMGSLGGLAKTSSE